VVQILSVIFICVGFGIILWALLKPIPNEVPPLEYIIKRSKAVWGLWFMGDRITEQHLIEKYDSIKRILLLDPESEAFKESVRKSIDTEERARRQIRQLTGEAKRKKIEVRWYNEVQESGITLYDPQSGYEPTSVKAECVFEIHDLLVLRDDRPKRVIRKISDETEFNLLIAKYNDLWNCKSREPKSEEYGSLNGIGCE
jgi:hypothetical protein